MALGLLTLSSPIRADDKELADKIHAAWAQRYDTVKTLRCEWTSKHRNQKWLYFLSDPDAKPMSKQDAERYKTQYFESFETATFLVAGDRMRLDTAGQQPRGPEGRMHEYDNKASYDGKLSVSFTPVTEDSGRPSARILNSNRCFAVVYFDTLPVRWAFCSDRITSRLTKIENAPVKMDHSLSNADVRLGPIQEAAHLFVTYWLDSKQGYSIKRMQSLPPRDQFDKGSPQFVVDCEYDRHPVGIWVPKHWLVTNVTKRGEVFGLNDCSMTKIELNPALFDADFHIEFPPGTAITDSRPGHQRKRKH